MSWTMLHPNLYLRTCGRNYLLRYIALLPLISTGLKSHSDESHQGLGYCKEQPSPLLAGLAVEACLVSRDILVLKSSIYHFQFY